MIRKALIGTAAAAVLGSFVFGRDVFSYARTWSTTVREAVKSEVPLDFEVDRARKMVENLVPDIRQCMHAIAEQQVDIDDLSKEISRKADRLDGQKDAILTLKSDLDTGKRVFVYARSSRSYTAHEVRHDLSQRFERFKAAEAMLERERQILRAHEKTMRANQTKLEELLAAKQDLQVEIAELEARLKTVQAAETVSSLEFDDSRLARAKKLIRELNKQLDVKEKLLDAEGRILGEIPVETAEEDTTGDVTRDIEVYFGTEPSSAELAELAELN